MSYDLQIYAPTALTADEVRSFLVNAGLDDIDLSAPSLMVVRGVRRKYSFTLALPVNIESEDVPDEADRRLTVTGMARATKHDGWRVSLATVSIDA